MPVVVLDDPARADDLGAALVAGGLPVAEATFRTPEAAAVLRRLAQRGDLVVGAGTVLTAAQVDLAHDAGARFVVSPGLSADVVWRCQALDLPVIPGVSTATEIMAALDLRKRLDALSDGADLCDRDVCYRSAFEGKADISQRLPNNRDL